MNIITLFCKITQVATLIPSFLIYQGRSILNLDIGSALRK